MRLPREYMALSLTDLVALHAPGATRSDGVDIEIVHASIDSLADRLKRQQAARAADQREWLAGQFDRIAVAPDAPTEGGRDA